MTTIPRAGQQDDRPERTRDATAEVAEAQTRPSYAKPKLSYVAPKLVKHGDVGELTGFFGPFSPPP
jgi:hypothetical protein